MKCFRCHKIIAELPRVEQPDGGVIFVAAGNFGSEVFDPMDGSKLQIIICDDCVEFSEDVMLVQRAVTYTNRIVPWKLNVSRQSN